MPRTKNVKFHQLKRPKIRQTWSKYNLYNLSRLTTPPAHNKTFFQQKWIAKALTRGYHHPQIKEKHWNRMFDRRLPAVVPMDYRYLARYDGSEQALGRGAGLDKEVDAEGMGEDGGMRRDKRGQKTPYMHMTFHPLERRLDTAIFRALFASSTKQARQFVVHGGVRVNGQKMIHPGYQLNPGDMFQVDPEKVLYATGARKVKKGSAVSRQDLQDVREKRRNAKAAHGSERDEEAEDGAVGMATLETDEEREALEVDLENESDPKKALRALVVRANRILDSKRELSGKRRQELREYSRTVRKTLSKLRGIEEDKVEDTIEGLETGLAEILTKIPQDDRPKDEAATAAAQATSDTESTTTTSSNPQMQDPSRVDNVRVKADAERLHAALERARENPIDVTKPYATPWKPREFMSAFAFIPRYLEVNQNICSAVYLRHPVARPGLAEVPTPFAAETMGLAFNWYLRRR